MNHHIKVGKYLVCDILWIDCTIDKTLKIRIAKTNPINPPNLLGIERRTAYKCKKYHSGWMWIGEQINLLEQS